MLGNLPEFFNPILSVCICIFGFIRQIRNEDRWSGKGDSCKLAHRGFEPRLWACVAHRRLLRGGGLIIMAGTKHMEWHQTLENHVQFI
jgi:hypothetical protein